MRIPSALKIVLLLPILLEVSACGSGGSNSKPTIDQPAQGQVTVNAGSSSPIALSVGQQLDDFVAFDQVNGMPLLTALAQDWFRIHAGADSSILPEPLSITGLPKWDFTALNRMVQIAYSANSTPILNVRHAPVSLSTCSSFHSSVGTLNDNTFGEFADYMADLVKYYNLGKFTDSNGVVHTNPFGKSHRVDYWELWNEPDLPYEYPCLRPSATQPALSISEFSAMWAITTQRMLAVDPSIQFIGPAVSDPRTLSYINQVLNQSNLPSAISVHGYAGPITAQDTQMLNGGGGVIGIHGITTALKDVLATLDTAGLTTIPLLLDEYNVSPDDVDDPYNRGWNNFSVALGGSLFIRNAALSANHPIGFIPFQFTEAGGLHLSEISSYTGQTLLPYWRDILIRQAYHYGDVSLGLTNTTGADVLATMRSDLSGVSILIANSYVNTAGSGTAGQNLSVSVDISALSGKVPKTITVTVIDSSTDPQAGPYAVSLTPSAKPLVTFNGFGLALVSVRY